MDLKDVENVVKQYSDARKSLSKRVAAFKDEEDALKRRFVPGIKRIVEEVTERYNRLSSLLNEAKHLFERPRTATFHGIKVGFQKQKGELAWEDDAAVVKLIRKHFPDQVDTMIKVVEKPIKAALATLTVAELKRLGVRVEDDSDKILIKTTDTEIDKLVEALLKPGKTEEEEAAA